MLQQLNLSFSGSGFLVVYQLGAVKCLLQHGTKCLSNVHRFAGASGGSLVATLLATDVSKHQVMLDTVYELARKIRKWPMRALTPGFHVTEEIRKSMDRLLDEDAHLLVRKKAYVSVTNLTRWRNDIFTDFQSREELIQCLICSCFIPFYDSFVFPRFRNEVCIDGGYSCMLPKFDKGRTVTVTPFSGETDIAPKDIPCDKMFKRAGQTFCANRENWIRLLNSVYPPPISVLEKKFQEGYDDATEFLKKEGWYT